MPPPEIPSRVLRFIDECIDSVAQLETVLMMNDEPGRHWTPADVAARNYVSSEAAARILDTLARRGLIAATEAGPAFRIAHANEESRALLEEVARTYRANLARISTLIHEKPSASLKEFARAFDLKKDH